MTDLGSVATSIRGSAVLGPAAKERLTTMHVDHKIRKLDGKIVTLQEEVKISHHSGERLAQLIIEERCENTLEIGLAYGFSTIYILSALSSTRRSFHHTMIDPFQTGKRWQGVGLDGVSALGWASKTTFIEKFSVEALTTLEKEKKKFDFIFIDGDHKFDGALFDFVLGDKILKVGGIIVLDDMWMPSVRKVVSFAKKNMTYDHLPEPKGVNNLATFKKRAMDTREWTHFVDF